MNKNKRKKILVGKVGLDGHDRGVQTVARALTDAGFDVVYSGLYHSPETFVDRAIDEDVDAIGMSVMTGAHNVILPKVITLLNERGAGGIPLFAGGIIPAEDIPNLKDMGISEVFLPGATLVDIVQFVKRLVNDEREESM